MSEAQVSNNEMKVIIFRLKDEEYGIDVNQVRSIERMQHITRVPRTPAFIKGVINLRGIVYPIINLRSRFELGEEEYTDSTRIIIVAVGDMEVGLIVDSANDVADITTSAIEPPPEVVGGIEVEYIRGVVKLENRLVILLNLEQVLSMQDVKQRKKIEV